MEEVLRAHGVADAKLQSTETAHRFYLGAGWIDSGPVEEQFGMRDYPMRKRLV
jgi:hypothetical protein